MKRPVELTSHTAKGVDKLTRYGWAVKDEPGELMSLPKHDLICDKSYQRDTLNGKVSAITQEWSYMACGALVVARRGSEYYVVDGGHRLAAALRRSDITHLPCIVFESKSVQQEAAGFIVIQTNRRAMSTMAKHRASLTAGDPIAAFVQTVLDHNRLILNTSSKSAGGIRCVGWLMQRAKDEPQVMARCVEVIAGICRREGVAVPERLLEGIWVIHSRCGKGLDDRRLLERLMSKSASELLDGANKAAAYYANGGGRVWAEGMLNVINKGLQHKFQLPPA